MQKEFDLIIYGATGFTGRLAAQYLLRKNIGSHLRIAIAGRDLQKLKEVQQSCEIKPALIVADSTHPASINEIVQKTHVILSLAGPFALYGEPVIAACAKFGVHYLDITGETPFIRNMIKRYQSEAQNTGARLIPFSGFDSVPADLCVYLALDAAQRQHVNLDQLSFYYRIKGGFNGGTLATALNMAEHHANELFDENSLIPDSTWPKDNISYFKPSYESYLQRWSAPFFMEPINRAVVRRSAWLRTQLCKERNIFHYEERLVMGKRFGFLQASLAIGMLATFGLLSRSSIGRKLIRRLGPKPGEGPSEEIRRQGYFRGTLICRSESIAKLAVHVEREGDPGNEITIALAAESACLAVENAFSSNAKGFLTPSTAFGDQLVKQLEKVGFRFKIEFL